MGGSQRLSQASFGGLSEGKVSRWMDTQGGDNYLWRIGVCVRVGKIAECHSRPSMP